MHFCVHWKPHSLFWFVLQSSNIESKSEDTRQAHYFFSEPVVARFMRFTAEQVKDSKCLSDLVVSGCTVGNAQVIWTSDFGDTAAMFNSFFQKAIQIHTRSPVHTNLPPPPARGGAIL